MAIAEIDHSKYIQTKQTNHSTLERMQYYGILRQKSNSLLELTTCWLTRWAINCVELRQICLSLRRNPFLKLMINLRMISSPLFGNCNTEKDTIQMCALSVFYFAWWFSLHCNATFINMYFWVLPPRYKCLKYIVIGNRLHNYSP